MTDRPDPPERPTVINRDDPAYGGQAAYTPTVLRTYDTIVLGISNRWIWRCPTPELVALYEANVGPAHIDAGPGTGYFLDVADLPQLKDLTLVDANLDVLEHAGRRLGRFRPTTVQANLLRPLRSAGGVDSAGLNFVLHCLPGTMADKAPAVAHLAALLRPGGRLFGSTILGTAQRHTRVGRRLMRIYNARGIFGNTHDNLDDLTGMLATHLHDVRVDVRGAVAIFSGTR